MHITSSKTHPFRQGCYIYIGAGNLCLVCALTQYLHVRGSTPGPLFFLSDGTPLYHQWLTSSIQSILPALGVPGCYTGHKGSDFEKTYQFQGQRNVIDSSDQGQ